MEGRQVLRGQSVATAASGQPNESEMESQGAMGASSQDNVAQRAGADGGVGGNSSHGSEPFDDATPTVNDWKLISEEAPDPIGITHFASDSRQDYNEGEGSSDTDGLNSGTVASEEDYPQVSSDDCWSDEEVENEEEPSFGFAWMLEGRWRKYRQLYGVEGAVEEDVSDNGDGIVLRETAQGQVQSAHAVMLYWNGLRKDSLSWQERQKVEEARARFVEAVIPYATEVKDCMENEELTLQDALAMKYVLAILEDYYLLKGFAFYHDYTSDVLPAWICYYRTCPEELAQEADALAIALSEATEGVLRSPDQCPLRFFQRRDEALCYYDEQQMKMLSMVEGITSSMYLH